MQCRWYSMNGSTQVFFDRRQAVSITAFQAFTEICNTKGIIIRFLYETGTFSAYVFIAGRRRGWKNENLTRRRRTFDREKWDVPRGTGVWIRRRGRDDELDVCASVVEGNGAVLGKEDIGDHVMYHLVASHRRWRPWSSTSTCRSCSVPSSCRDTVFHSAEKRDERDEETPLRQEKSFFTAMKQILNAAGIVEAMSQRRKIALSRLRFTKKR